MASFALFGKYLLSLNNSVPLTPPFERQDLTVAPLSTIYPEQTERSVRSDLLLNQFPLLGEENDMNIDALDKLGGKQRALFAAFQLFLQHGVDGTSIDEVVKVAAISRGGLYHHFDSKEALYEAVLEHYFLRGYSEFDLAIFDDLSFEAQKQTLTNALSAMFEDVTHRYGVDKARYFALYFESLSRSVKFKLCVQRFYTALHLALEDKAPSKHAALSFMRLVEGEIYFATLYDRSPDFTSLTGCED